MRSTEILRYTNANGERVEFSFNSTLIPTSFTDSLDINFYTTKNALEDGESLEGNDFEPRSLVIKAVFQGTSTAGELERRIKKVFNPKLSGVLEHTDGNETKEIAVNVESVPEISFNKALGNVTVKLIAFSSYWCKAKVTEQLAYLTPTFVFPQSFAGPVTFGRKITQLINEIQNIGDAECGYMINIKAATGSVSNPFIRNNKTGETIKFNLEMAQNDVVTVDYMSPQPIVYKNGVKDFSILNALESDFFKLAIGANTLEYGASVNVANLTISLSYKPLIL